MRKKTTDKAVLPRRKFIAAAGTAALAFPAISRGQTGATSMRFQSAWPEKDSFFEYGLEFAKTVNDMTGGDLRIEMLPVNAVVPPSGLLDVVSKGGLDGCHATLTDHYNKNTAFALWGSGPAYGLDANMLLAWHRSGGGKELLDKIYSSIGATVVSFLYAPQFTPALGWFKNPITKIEDFKGVKYRTTGISIDVFNAMGAEATALPAGDVVAAIENGKLDAAQSDNMSSDRKLGLAGVSKVCMLQSYHRSAEQLEILFNKSRYEALPARLRAVITGAVDAASQTAAWKAIDINSHDFGALTQDNVHFYKTPDAVLIKELDCYDEVLAKKAKENPLFKEILDSQKKFAERAVKWEQEIVVRRRLAYDHYFNHPPPPPPKKT